MANTNDLKNVKSLPFWNASGRILVRSLSCHLLAYDGELFGMEFDGIGIHRKQRSLFFCETTASGFLGNRGRDFHVGATKKFSDSFARFSIIIRPPVQDGLLRSVGLDYGFEFK